MDIASLLPNGDELEKLKKENFEHSLTMRLLKDFGAGPEGLRRAKQAGKYDLDMFYAEYPNFPWKMQIDRVERYSVEELFQKPTRSPVFQKLVEYFPEWNKEPVLLFFKAKGFGVLVMGTAGALKRCEVFLTAAVRGSQFHVTTYEEFTDAVRDIGLLDT